MNKRNPWFTYNTGALEIDSKTQILFHMNSIQKRYNRHCQNILTEVTNQLPTTSKYLCMLERYLYTYRIDVHTK